MFDVAVVGAGLGGLRSAVLLAQRGLKVLILDRKTQIEKPVYTTGIFVRKTLEDFATDLPQDCLGPPVQHVALYSPGGQQVLLQSPQPEFRLGKMGRLYARLLQEAVAAGAQCRLGTHYLRAEQHTGGVLLHLEAQGRLYTQEARFLIGADGAYSRVARDLGLSINQNFIVGLEDVYVGVPLKGPPIFHCLLDAKLSPGYLAWAIHDGEEVHLGVGGYRHRFEPLIAMEQFKQIASRWLDLSNAQRIERRGGRIPVGGVLPNLVNPRGLLVGDAAGAVSPLTAGGLDPCMRMPTLAAQVLPAYLQNPNPNLWQAYSGSQWRKRFSSRLWMRQALDAAKAPWLLDAGVWALRFGPLRGLAERVFFGRGSFPDLETAGPQS